MIERAGTPNYETAGQGIQPGQVLDVGGAVIFVQDAAGVRLYGPAEEQQTLVRGTLVLEGEYEVFVEGFEFLAVGMVEIVAHMPTSDWSADYARRAARTNRAAVAAHNTSVRARLIESIRVQLG